MPASRISSVGFRILSRISNFIEMDTRVLICLAVAMSFPGHVITAQGPLIGRALDPVVITGAQAACLLGADPQLLVGFAFDTIWTQIPIQVDERAWLDLTVPYGPLPDSAVGAPALFYTDTLTYTGPDTNALFDADDELVLMARDAGAALDVFYNPAGVIPGTCCRIQITDPLSTDTGYVYLFVQDGTLSQDADTSYVTHEFVLLAGSYPDDYNLASGPNPEQTTISTPHYEVHFADRWIQDEMRIYADSATGVDLLDRHQNFYAPGVCVRTEDTFSAGEGCFATLRDGPVRAIRSYLGANSGPLTQRTHLFYESQHVAYTDLRVHPIPSVFDTYDFNVAAFGMTVYSNIDTSGSRVIDGAPDSYVDDSLTWELITGAQGSLIISHGFEGTYQPGIDGTYGYYWADDSTDMMSSCTGDMIPLGTTGLYTDFNSDICTDPVLCAGSPSYRSFRGWRTQYYTGPGTTVTEAMVAHAKVQAPLEVTAEECCTDNTLFVWSGTISANWHEQANWHCRGVLIPLVTSQPQVAAGDTARCGSLEIHPLAQLMVQSGGHCLIGNQ